MADESQPINPDEIERLLASSSAGSSPPEAAKPASDSPHQNEIETGLGGGGQEPDKTLATPTSTSQAAQAPQAASVGDTGKLPEQDQVEKLLDRDGAAPLPPSQPAATEQRLQDPVLGESGVAQGDMEYLLDQAERALQSIDSELGQDPPAGVTPFQFHEFTGAPATTEKATLDLIRDVELDLKIELGRTHMYLEDILKIRKGSVVPLDKLAGDPVDVYVNGRLIARGEVLVLNDNFCVRVAELIAGATTVR